MKRTETTRTLAMQTLAAQVVPDSADREARTVDVRFYSGEKVRRYDYWNDSEFYLQFSLKPGDVRLARAKGGGSPVLNNHASYRLENLLGVVEDPKVDGKEGRARLRLSGRDDVAPLWTDIQDGILRNVSMGAFIHRMEDVTEDEEKIPTFLAVDWELIEISLVCIGADPNAQTLSSDAKAEARLSHPCIVISKGTSPEKEDGTMKRKLARRLNDAIDTKVSGERTREGVIKDMALRCGLSVEEVGDFLLDEDGARKRPASMKRAALEGMATELGIGFADLRADAVADELEVTLAAPRPEPPAPTPAPAIPAPTPDPGTGGQVIQLSQVQDMVKRAQADARRDERERASKIREKAKLACIESDSEIVLRWIESEMTLEEVTDAALNERARRDREVDTVSHIRMGVSETEKIREAITGALLHRFRPDQFKIEPASREFVGMSLMELARWHVQREGKAHLIGGSRNRLAELALQSTSDFPNILANVGHKALLDGYNEKPPTYQEIARRSTARDFREIARVRLGAVPTLKKVLESGEFNRATLAESKEAYRLFTYGIVIAITRQVLINDDIGAFTDIPRGAGASARRMESDTVWGLIIANAVMGDGIAFFHANHGNLGSGAISDASLDAGWQAVANQKGLALETLDITPKFLIVPNGLRVAAMRFVGPLAKQRIVATKGVDIAVFADDLTIISEPRLPATVWYLAAAPGDGSGIEYAYLEGEEGIASFVREGFDVDGTEFKTRLDFGAGVLDYRGWFKSTGV